MGSRTGSWRRGHRGYSLLEVSVAITVIVALMAVLVDRLWYYAELAEKRAMEDTVATLRKAMYLRSIELAGWGNLEGIRKMSRENPIRWLEVPPANYAGERDGALGYAPREWYYDRKRLDLVYVPRNHRYLSGSPGGEIRFHTRLVEGKGGGVSGLIFEPEVAYIWF